MLWLLLGTAIGLALLNLRQWQTARRRRRQLAYLQQRLSAMIAQDGDEQILLPGAETELRPLLVAVNGLLIASRRGRAAQAAREVAQDQLLANMAHDLKTPLTVVRGLTETLASDAELDPAERLRLSAAVHAKTVEAVTLLGRFLDLARLEAHAAAIPLRPADVAESCRTTLLFFYEAIARRGLAVAVDIPETPVYALANAEAVSRVLHNLLANALRYWSGGGYLELALRVGGRGVAIDVVDRGPGIAARHQAHVFERHYTVDAARGQAGGSGLGLPIARRLAQLMGGRLTLQSQPHTRTVFTLELQRTDRIA